MDFVQKIDKLRDQIHQINEELTWLEESPVTKEEFRARVIEWVTVNTNNAEDIGDRLAWLSRPNSAASKLDMLKISSRVHVPGSTHPTVAPVDISIARPLAWLFGEQIKEALLAKVDAMDYVPGLPLADRPARRDQLLKDRRVLEEKEEALICESEEANAPIYRRADADPAVVLNYDPEGVMGAEGPRNVYASGLRPPANPASDAAVKQAIGQSVMPMFHPR